MTTLAFFNNKGGVGKTTLVFHLAWMFAQLGRRVLVADLDPQANVTSAFLDEEKLEELWQDRTRGSTVYECVAPLIKAVGDVAEPAIIPIGDKIALIPGSLELARFEDQLSETWPKCLDGDTRAFRITSAFARMTNEGAKRHRADIVLVDVGPNLGAINRSALIATDLVVVPLAPDLFSLQGLRNLGPMLREWRNGWEERRKKKPKDLEFELPKGRMLPIGYVVMQHSQRLDRPVRAYDKWMARIPQEYLDSVANSKVTPPEDVDHDSNCIASLKHYRSLIPMAQEMRKPMFALTAADGALGAHGTAARKAGEDFKAMASKIENRARAALAQG